jgi:acetylornithine/succinyldiaminopimelate/putrescine aminotransferase
MIRAIRAAGLLVGADLEGEAAPIVEACLSRGLLVNAVRPNTLRFAPPLVVSAEEVDRALEILNEVFASAAVPQAVSAEGS